MAGPKAVAVVVASLNRLGCAIGTDATQIWEQVLAPISDELLMPALMRFLREHKWGGSVMPGAVYQAATAIMREEFPSPGEAWEMARRGVPAAGPIRVACGQVGRETMELLEVGDSATRARFLEFYARAVDEAVRTELRLAGPTCWEMEDAPQLPASSDRKRVEALHGDSVEIDNELVDVRGLVRELIRGEEANDEC